MVASHLVKEKNQLVLLCAPGTSLGRCPPGGAAWVQQSLSLIARTGISRTPSTLEKQCLWKYNILFKI